MFASKHGGDSEQQDNQPYLGGGGFA
jgi:hypothetical protein